MANPDPTPAMLARRQRALRDRRAALALAPPVPAGCAWLPVDAKGRDFALIDADLFHRLMQWSWFVHRSQRYQYKATVLRPRLLADPPGPQSIRLANVVTGRTGLVDHINGNGLDNRRTNLRAATHADNARNTRKRKPGRSRYKGVFPQKGKWRAFIGVNYRRIYLGYFDTEVDAARAYDAAAVLYHGEFAALNLPRD